MNFEAVIPQDLSITANPTFAAVNSCYLKMVATDNYSFGSSGTMDALTTGNYNTCFGYDAGTSLTEGSENTFIGYQSGYSCTTGEINCFFGRDSGYSITSGSYNIAIGFQTLYNETDGTDNVAIGENALFTQDGGTDNVGIGDSAGYSCTTGGANVFIGRESGYACTTGGLNVFIGDSAGHNNTTGSYNVVIGTDSGRGGDSQPYLHNVYIGYQSGYVCTSGSNNCLIGDSAGYSITTGSGNVCIGYNSGKTNATGSNELWIANSDVANTASLIYGTFDGATPANQTLKLNATVTCLGNVITGTLTLGSGSITDSSGTIDFGDETVTVDKIEICTTTSTVGQITQNGSHFIHTYGTNNVFMGGAGNFTLNTTNAHSNVGIGLHALDSLDGNPSGGYYNVGIGVDALTALTDGAQNTGMGFRALYSCNTGTNNVGLGAYSLNAVNSGSGNFGLGTYAFRYITTQYDNIGIGYAAGRYYTGSNPLTSATQCIFIGSYTTALANTTTNEIIIGYSMTGHGSNTVTIGTTNTNYTYLNGVIGSVTTITDAGPTDNVDVAGINIVEIDTNANNVTIGGFVNGIVGQYIFVVVTDASNNAVLEHNEGTGNQDIFLNSGGDDTLTASYGGWKLICDGSNWYEVYH